MTRLSLTEVAKAFGMSKGYLSQRTSERKPAKGHHLYRYAVREDGRVTGFEVPDSMLPHGFEHGGHESDHDSGRGSGMEGHDAPHGDPSSAHNERTNVCQTNKRSVNEERENPAGAAESVATGVASGAVTELAKEGVKAMVKPVKEADDPEQAATIGGWVKDAFLEVSPLLAGAAWAYTHRESTDVQQIAGSLLAAAGVDLLVHGEKSIIVRFFMDGSSAESSSQPKPGMEGPSAEDVERDFRERAAGDGVPLDVEPGFDGALDSIGAETE